MIKLINPLDLFRPRLLEDVETYFDRHKKEGKPAPNMHDEFLRRVLACLRSRPDEWNFEDPHCCLKYGRIEIWVANHATTSSPNNFNIYRPIEIDLKGHELFDQIRHECKKILAKRETFKLFDAVEILREFKD